MKRCVVVCAGVVMCLAIGAAVPAAAADGKARATSKTTVAGTAVPPLLDASWSNVRRHGARLDVSGRNVVGAESTVAASVRFVPRRGSYAAWCTSREFSYRPVAGMTDGTISSQWVVVHSDGSRDRSRRLVARYTGDPSSVGEVYGATMFAQLTGKRFRAGDVVVFRVKIALDSPMDDLQESIHVTAAC